MRGRPPLSPLRRAAAAFASLRILPPLRPKATAAAFLRGMALEVLGDVLRTQFGDALQRQFGDFDGQGLERGDVARFEGGIPTSHQVAACLVHSQIVSNRLGYVKRHIVRDGVNSGPYGEC